MTRSRAVAAAWVEAHATRIDFVRIGSARLGAAVHLAVDVPGNATPICGTRLRRYWRWSQAEFIDCKRCQSIIAASTNLPSVVAD